MIAKSVLAFYRSSDLNHIYVIVASVKLSPLNRVLAIPLVVVRVIGASIPVRSTMISSDVFALL